MSASTNTENTSSSPNNTVANNDYKPGLREAEHGASPILTGSNTRSQEARPALGVSPPAMIAAPPSQPVHISAIETSSRPIGSEANRLPPEETSSPGQPQVSNIPPEEQKIKPNEIGRRPDVAEPPLPQSTSERAENRIATGDGTPPQSPSHERGGVVVEKKPNPSSAIPSGRSEEASIAQPQTEIVNPNQSPPVKQVQGGSAGSAKVDWGSVVLALHAIHLERVEGVRAGLQTLGIKDEYIKKIVGTEANTLTHHLVESLKKYAMERSRNTTISLDKLVDRFRSNRNEAEAGLLPPSSSEPRPTTWWSNLEKEVKRKVLENSEKAVMELKNSGIPLEVGQRLAEAVVEAEVNKLMGSIEAYGKARAQKAQASRKRISDRIFEIGGITFSSPSAEKRIVNRKK